MSHPRAGSRPRPRTSSTSTPSSRRYYDRHPDADDPEQQVAFGTSGHRGSPPAHGVQRGPHPRHDAGDLRLPAAQGIDGPLFIGRDTHGLSEPAWRTALEVLVANGVTVLVDAATASRRRRRSRTRSSPPTAARHRRNGLADGIVVTPSHNPPARRRLQVQPAARRPGRHRRDRLDRRPRQRAASRRASGRQARRRSREARARHHGALRLPRHLRRRPARRRSTSTRSATPGVRIGADPLGGASVDYWGEIGERHGLDLTVVNPRVDPHVARS